MSKWQIRYLLFLLTVWLLSINVNINPCNTIGKDLHGKYYSNGQIIGE